MPSLGIVKAPGTNRIRLFSFSFTYTMSLPGIWLTLAGLALLPLLSFTQNKPAREMLMVPPHWFISLMALSILGLGIHMGMHIHTGHGGWRVDHLLISRCRTH